jgi:hypothetical protein
MGRTGQPRDLPASALASIERAASRAQHSTGPSVILIGDIQCCYRTTWLGERAVCLGKADNFDHWLWLPGRQRIRRAEGAIEVYGRPMLLLCH